MEERGNIVVYYGEGRGKTSAALGTAVRAAGDGKTVYIIQFLKGQMNYEFLSRLEPEVKSFRFERSNCVFDDLTDEEKQDQKANIQNGLNFAKKVLVTGECDILILDEVLGLMPEKMATADQIVEVLKAKSPLTTVILTGRTLPDEIAEIANNILNIVPEK